MALQFGLNIKPKSQANIHTAGKAKEKPKKKSIFDDESDDEPTSSAKDPAQGEEIAEFNASSLKKSASVSTGSSIKPKSKLPAQPPPLKSSLPAASTFGDLATDRASRLEAEKATGLDASIYDYDAFHDAHSSVSAAKKAADRQDALERKPKYIDNLLDAAERRKKDQLVAKEKLLQREREAEGDEFADKEKFVTGAYKAQQEEARNLEEEEAAKAAVEEKRRKQLGGGMTSFYRGVMSESEKRHQEAMAATKKLESGEKTLTAEEKRKTDEELAREAQAKGVNVQLNEEGQITDKRQLLSAGLNVAPSGKAGERGNADHLKTRDRAAAQNTFQTRRDDQHAMRERQSKMLQDQLTESAKRAADEEAEELRKREHAAKSKKTDTEISSARERYLARKREKELAEKGG